jgi:2-keto-3-deoxy-L-rhamnonate aldolase RhmA
MVSMKERIHKSEDPLGGYLCLIPSPIVTQALASAGADWLVIDQEHGSIGMENLHAMIAATAARPAHRGFASQSATKRSSNRLSISVQRASCSH